MRIEYQVSKADVEAFGRFLIADTRAIERSHRGGWIAVPFVGLIVLFGVRPTSAGGMWLSVLSGMAGWALLWAVITNGTREKVLEQLVSGDAGKAAVGKHALTLQPDGIREERPQGEVFHRWNAVRRVVVTVEAIYLMVGEESGYLLPSGAFPSPDAKQVFLDSVARLRQTAREDARGEAATAEQGDAADEGRLEVGRTDSERGTDHEGRAPRS